jgi:hypothetical protein
MRSLYYGPVTRNRPREVLSIGFEGSVSISSAFTPDGLEYLRQLVIEHKK